MQVKNVSQFDRGAWFILALVIFLLLWGAVGILYVMSLPTDGWYAKVPDNPETYGQIYQQNLMGAPSDLQPGDQLTAVNGIPVAAQDLTALASQWSAGSRVNYTVARNGSETTVAVPLVYWTLPVALQWFDRIYGFAIFLGQFVFMAIATLAFFKRPGDHAARALFLYAALFFFLYPFLQVWSASVNATVFPAIALMGGASFMLAYSVLFPPTLLWLALVFPHPVPLVQRHPWVEYSPFFVGLLMLPLLLLTGGIIGFGWTIVSIVGAIAILIHSYLTMHDSVSRAQLRWGIWGLVLGTLLVLATFLVTFGFVSGTTAAIINLVGNLSFALIGITLGIAILRYRLFDIGILIRRTLTYALVTALLLVVFFGCVIALQQLFSLGTGSGQNELVTVLSTLTIAALFVPLRNRVQAVIDRRFNRNKYNAQLILQKFGETVRDETDLERLNAELMNVVQETMQPRSVSLWVKPDQPSRYL